VGYHLLGNEEPIWGIPRAGLDRNLNAEPAVLVTLPRADKTGCLLVVGFKLSSMEVGQYTCSS
jgi:hypothetical protein